MCINLGGSGKEGSGLQSTTTEEWEEKNKPETEQEIADKLKEGPAPTTLGAKKSSAALINRRRQLIDSYKYGLSSTFKRKTNLNEPITKAKGPLIKPTVGRRNLSLASEVNNNQSTESNTTRRRTRGEQIDGIEVDTNTNTRMRRGYRIASRGTL
ncbi:MAG: hypothetical protein GY797_33430 [Deltaproteobacteria bacterium]|nr:hypothetical protein [Deltaproteobacteria bacterium]